MLLYHGSGQMVPYPEIRMGKFKKDFAWGFYCTNNKEQAIRWAQKNATPVLNLYTYTEDPSLRILRFPEMTEEWLDFIIFCRSGGLHKYDIVEGPMADDQVWNYVNSYLDNKIPREVFWMLAKFRHPTHQISFHTMQALACLQFQEAQDVTGRTIQ